jgi:hypothetical protein
VAAEENLCGEELVLTSESDEIASEINSVTTAVASTQTRTYVLGKQLFSACTMRNEHLHYYTGLENYIKFKLVLATLGCAANKLEYYNGSLPTVSIEDQFLITLMKLRVHHPNEELALLFGIDRKQISNIFITWINFHVLSVERTMLVAREAVG